MTTTDLIAKADAHLRRAPNENRRAELLAAGLPADDRAALARWLERAQDARHEAAGGLYLAATARIANGVDHDLPTEGYWGCRVERVALRAHRDDEIDAWVVGGGQPYVGAQEAAWLQGQIAANELEAEEIVRQRLLRRGDCFRTRAEAAAAAVVELRKRAATGGNSLTSFA